MIELKVEKYCENCPEFEPDISRFSFINGCGDDFYGTTVSCKHKARCAEIAEYMRERYEDKTKQ